MAQVARPRFGSEHELAIGQCLLCQTGVFIWLLHGRVHRTEPRLTEQLPENLPDNVERAFDEALLCQAAGAPNGALCMARRSLDDSLEQLGAKKRDLPTRLDDLVEKRKTTPELREWADQARIGGELAAHGTGGDEWGQPDLDWAKDADAEEVLGFLRPFFEYVYVMPARIVARKGGDSPEAQSETDSNEQ